MVLILIVEVEVDLPTQDFLTSSPWHQLSLMKQSKSKYLVAQAQTELSFVKDQWPQSLLISSLSSELRSHFRTKVQYRAQEWKLSCECPAFEKDHHCEHIGSTLLLYVRDHRQQHLGSTTGSEQVVNEVIDPSVLVLAATQYYLPAGHLKDIYQQINRSSYSIKRSIFEQKNKDIQEIQPHEFRIVLSFHLLSAADRENMTLGHGPLLGARDYGHLCWSLVSTEESDQESTPFENLVFFYQFQEVFIIDLKNGKKYLLNTRFSEFLSELGAQLNKIMLQDEALLLWQKVQQFYPSIEWAGVSKQEQALPYLSFHFSPKPQGQGQLLISAAQAQDENIKYPLPLIFCFYATKELFSLNSKDSLMQATYFQQALKQFLESSIYNSLQSDYSMIEPFIGSLNHLGKTLIELQQKYQDRSSELTLRTVDEDSTLLFFERQKWETFLKTILEFIGTSSYGHFSWQNNHLVLQASNGFLEQLLIKMQDHQEQLAPLIRVNDRPIKHWKPNLEISRLDSGLDWFDIQLSIHGEDQKILLTQENSAGALIIGENETLLLKNEQRLLLQYFQGRQAKETGQVTLKFHKNRLLELYYLELLGEKKFLTDKEREICRILLKQLPIPESELPVALKDVLRDYQKDGHRWLSFLHQNKLGGCLADDMGLGKTLQIIALLDSLGDQLGHCLIICPVSVLFNWQEELKKFSNLPVHLFYGDQRKIPKDPCVILTSYALLKKDQASYFRDHEFNVLVFDEIQQIKNPHSQGAKAAKSLKAKVRFALTGTPVENHIGEYFNIMDCCVPGLWGDRVIRRKETEDQGHIVQLLSRPYVLRRTKDQVLKELPPKTEQRIYLSFDEEESRRYQDSLLQIRNNVLQRGQEKQVASMLKNLLELRRLCLWQQQQEGIISSKLNFLIDRLMELNEEGHQSLVFSQFTSFLDLIEERIKKKNLTYSRIDGSLALLKRQQQVVQFQQGQNQVFLISLKAGGFGLNLTKARYVFLMDPWWNPAVEQQAIDRAHRIGQTHPLTVYKILIKDSIEEKVLKLQEKKMILFESLLRDMHDPLSGISYDDLRALLFQEE